MVDSDVVDDERLFPGVEPLVTGLPELPPLGVGVVPPGGRRLTSLIERPAASTVRSYSSEERERPHLTGRRG